MEIAQKIRDVGIKATSQRRVVYTVLSKLGHASAEEITTAVRELDPSITIATVYRILDSFREAGLIAELSTTTGKLHYDVTPSEHHHIYLPNGDIVDSQDSEVADFLSEHFKGKTIDGRTIRSVKLQIFVD